MKMNDPETPEEAWQALAAHLEEIYPLSLRDLFDRDPGRFGRFSAEACGLLLDTSKQLIDQRTVDLLVCLGGAMGIEERRDRMFAGDIVNETEGRPALHTALRNRSNRPVFVEGENVMPGVRSVLAKMKRFSEAVRDGTRTGFTGKRFTDVVNIGIGGSDLGPDMAAVALDAYREPGLRAHYVSNLDGSHVEGVLRDLDPETTLFIVASKTFSTLETLTNAHSARRWLLDALQDPAAVARHFVAVSRHRERVVAFGIDPEDLFVFWDWVGGRFSVWSAVGLSLAVVLGMDVFEALLDGAYAMDEHFRTAPLGENLPVLMGLLGVWNTVFFGAGNHAVLPYDYALRRLPAHLQQLEMESNGKRVSRTGEPVGVPTCPVVWGGPGDNGQHAYYQLLHQGTPFVPSDFLVALESQTTWTHHQDAVLANAFAQSEALMRGRTAEDAYAELRAAGLEDDEASRLVPHKVVPGNQPSNTILYRRLTPEILGALVALYEHKVLVQSVIWEINPFDQWGVELGKQLAGRILDDLRADDALSGYDASTQALIERAREVRRGG